MPRSDSRPSSRDDTYYAAMLARDPRFDGKFFIGVKTTGIYCRPICQARPKRENVEFFPSMLAAERAGYRPCLRCRPESAPESPVWIGKSAMVRRAVKLIGAQASIELDEDRFAALFGVSARHLRRVFVAEIGKTPKQLSFERRLGLARTLLVETSLPITEIAFAAGFNSVRRFNDAFRDRFTRKPSEVRRRRVADHAPLRVSLAYRPPFDFEGLLRIYRSHQVGDLESFAEGRMSRVIEHGGKVGEVTITNEPAASRLQVEIDFPDTTAIHVVLARVRALFDLDSDPIIVANALETDPGLRRLLRKHPGIRLPSGWDAYETGIGVILGQLVSVAHGRTLVAELVEIAGEESGRRRDGRAIKLFPSPEKVAALGLSGLRKLRTSDARKRTLLEFSRQVATRELSLEPTQDVDRFVERVREIPGVGTWTASLLAMKVLRHTDAFPHSDLIVARALAKHGTATVRLSPWRGYAAALYWREYAGTKRHKEKA